MCAQDVIENYLILICIFTEQKVLDVFGVPSFLNRKQKDEQTYSIIFYFINWL